MTKRIPCTECRKRKETEKELKTLKSEHAKVRRSMAHRLNKIGDLEDTVKRLRASVKSLRNSNQRIQTRHHDLLVDRDDLRKALIDLKKRITKAMEDSHLG